MRILNANSVDKGLQDGWTRATFVLRKDYLKKLKAVSYWDRKKMKQVIDEALRAYLKGKRIKSIPNEEGIERKMKKIILAVVSVVVLAGVSYAQECKRLGATEEPFMVAQAQTCVFRDKTVTMEQAEKDVNLCVSVGVLYDQGFSAYLDTDCKIRLRGDKKAVLEFRKCWSDMGYVPIWEIE